MSLSAHSHVLRCLQSQLPKGGLEVLRLVVEEDVLTFAGDFAFAALWSGELLKHL